MAEQKIHQPRKKIGLALGGGGAKGLAHIGVIKALEEEKIPIDFIAGTSMGALVGGWYAATENIVFLENIFLKIKESDLIPSQAVKGVESSRLFKSEAFAKFLKGILDGKKIEQCLLPFRAVATDVENGKEVILSEGSIVDAIRASIALPVVFKPVKVGERLLMDGGVANPVPADEVREMGADFVIAIDISSRWIRLDDELVKGKNMPSLISIAFSVMEYEVARQVLKQADIVLRPPVMTYDWLEFFRAKEIIEAGYRETKRRLKEIRKKSGCSKRPPETAIEMIIDLFGGYY